MQASFPEEIIRAELISGLENTEDVSDEEILERLDDIILKKGRELHLSVREKETLRKNVFDSVRGLDVIQELVDDPFITEIMVNGHENIFYEMDGCIFRYERKFASEERLMDIIQKIAGKCNRVVNEQSPIVDARLENGDRVNIVLPPVALCGAVLTIRRFPECPVTLKNMIDWGSITQEAADFLVKMVRARYSMLIGGGTSTGKTTFLGALSEYIPKDERIVTIEDNAELKILGIENLVSLETKNANLKEAREVTIRDLIRTALRMRPSRIIIGEVRGAEAGDFLTCLNTGHSGSLGTAHANSTKDMLGRIESMVRMGQDLPIDVIRSQIASGIEILIQLGRDEKGARKVYEITEITGISKGAITLNTLFERQPDGTLARTGELYNRGKLDAYEKTM